VLSGFVSVELVRNFHYSHLNFLISIFNECTNYWDCIINFFLFDHVEILKADCHKRKRMVPMRNLLLEFEVSFIFCAIPIFVSFLTYQKTRPYRNL
jgi:hypothetical protein